jgi:hypothetical protein
MRRLAALLIVLGGLGLAACADPVAPTPSLVGAEASQDSVRAGQRGQPRGGDALEH